MVLIKKKKKKTEASYQFDMRDESGLFLFLRANKEEGCWSTAILKYNNNNNVYNFSLLGMHLWYDAQVTVVEH